MWMRTYMFGMCVWVWVCAMRVLLSLARPNIWFWCTHHTHAHTIASSRIDLAGKILEYMLQDAHLIQIYSTNFIQIMNLNKLHSFNICVCIIRIYNIYAVMVINYVRRIAFDTEQRKHHHHHQPAGAAAMRVFRTFINSNSHFCHNHKQNANALLQHILCIWFDPHFLLYADIQGHIPIVMI